MMMRGDRDLADERVRFGGLMEARWTTKTVHIDW